jgi:hypothetical protein
MSNAAQAQIQKLLSSFTQELDLLVRRATFEALHRSLTDGDFLTRSPAAPPVRPARKARGRRARDLGDASNRVLAQVRSQGGQGIRAIAEALGLELPRTKQAVQRLLATGALQKSGAKRGTVYHLGRRAMTDETPRPAKRVAKPKRRVRAQKPAKTRARAKSILEPVRRRSVPKPTAPAAAERMTDVPAALAL